MPEDVRGSARGKLSIRLSAHQSRRRQPVADPAVNHGGNRGRIHAFRRRAVAFAGSAFIAYRQPVRRRPVLSVSRLHRSERENLHAIQFPKTNLKHISIKLSNTNNY